MGQQFDRRRNASRLERGFYALFFIGTMGFSIWLMIEQFLHGGWFAVIASIVMTAGAFVASGKDVIDDQGTRYRPRYSLILWRSGWLLLLAPSVVGFCIALAAKLGVPVDQRDVLGWFGLIICWIAGGLSLLRSRYVA